MLEVRHHSLQMEINNPVARERRGFVFFVKFFATNFFWKFKSYPQFCYFTIVFVFYMRDN